MHFNENPGKLQLKRQRGVEGGGGRTGEEATSALSTGSGGEQHSSPPPSSGVSPFLLLANSEFRVSSSKTIRYFNQMFVFFPIFSPCATIQRGSFASYLTLHI